MPGCAHVALIVAKQMGRFEVRMQLIGVLADLDGVMSRSALCVGRSMGVRRRERQTAVHNIVP